MSAEGGGRPAAPRRLAPGQYVEGVLRGDRGVLSRVITLIESRRADDYDLSRRVLDALLPHAGRSTRVGVTGVPGAGKSTLIERLGLDLIRRGKRVAVLAIDPSSRVSGGSVLGDKTRMTELSHDPGAFIRPTPSGGSLGGVARCTRETMLACEAAGYDVVLVETVGVGQAETVAADMVDSLLVVLIAGAGDELQGIKRGLIEVADLIAVNKADGDNRARVERAVGQLRTALGMLHPAGGVWTPPVVACSALEGEGVDALWANVLAHRAALEGAGLFEDRRRGQAVSWMWDLVNEQVQRALKEGPKVRGVAARLEAEVRAGRTTAAAAADAVVRALGLTTDDGR